MRKDRIAYIYNTNLRRQCDQLPTIKYRATIVQDLLNCYGIMKHVDIVSPSLASHEDLLLFHDNAYLEFTKRKSFLDKTEESQAETFGLLYDCPLLENTYEFIRTVAGGTLTAARILNEKTHRIVINWFGGWHHAQKSKASGFCYVNDVVLGIKTLDFKKILYLDLDVHHGDGVENAFKASDSVLTLSIHKYSPGFYPGTGGGRSDENSDAINAINIPLLDGISDSTYQQVFNHTFDRILDRFPADCFVVQCGADILAGDPLGQCNVTMNTMGDCLKKIVATNKPVMLLGGGGYHIPNTARYWTYLSAQILECDICEDIPEQTGFFNLYTPTFELKIDPILGRKDYNSSDYLKHLFHRIDKVCKSIK